MQFVHGGLCMTSISVVDSLTPLYKNRSIGSRIFVRLHSKLSVQEERSTYFLVQQTSTQLYGMILDNQVRWSVSYRNLSCADSIQW